VPVYYIMSERPFEETAAALLMKYHRFVFRQARRAVPFPDLAEDVAQQTFVDFLAKADQWDLEKDLRPLLMTMVQRCARSVWRDRAKLVPEALQRIGEYIQQELNEDNDVQEDRLTALRGCLQKLPEGGHKLIMRYYFDGIPTKQIAEELQKTADAVGKAIYRTRERLRLCIEQTLKAEGHHG
jgi:RNA polymerase sigma-70 factor (ECF subfamily)